MYHNLGDGYEIINVPLPLVQIRCFDENGIEDVTVWDDCTGEDLHAVLDACEVAYEKWRGTR